jgi:hypothetical protein
MTSKSPYRSFIFTKRRWNIFLDMRIGGADRGKSFRMDGRELVQFVAALESAIGAARAASKFSCLDASYCMLVERAQEMHDRLMDSLLVNEEMATPYLLALASSTGSALDDLSALIARDGGRLH